MQFSNLVFWNNNSFFWVCNNISDRVNFHQSKKPMQFCPLSGKAGIKRGIHYFLFYAQKQRVWVLVGNKDVLLLTILFRANVRKMSDFLLWKLSFCSHYKDRILQRLVYVMQCLPLSTLYQISIKCSNHGNNKKACR